MNTCKVTEADVIKAKLNGSDNFKLYKLANDLNLPIIKTIDCESILFNNKQYYIIPELHILNYISEYNLNYNPIYEFANETMTITDFIEYVQNHRSN